MKVGLAKHVIFLLYAAILDWRHGVITRCCGRVVFSMKKILIFAVTIYRKYISPAFPPHCRFIPTCSQYALTALSRYGAFKGTLLTVWRILRCNPFCKGGYDPVP